jgi:hypothetical protein
MKRVCNKAAVHSVHNDTLLQEVRHKRSRMNNLVVALHRKNKNCGASLIAKNRIAIRI